jgi:hypothetical protein
MPPGGYSLRATWFRSNLSRLLQLSCYPNHLGTDTERGEAELRRHTCNLNIGGIRPRAAFAALFFSSLLGSTAMLDNRRGSAFERLSSCAGQRTPVRMHCAEGIRGLDWCFTLNRRQIYSSAPSNQQVFCTTPIEIFTSFLLLLYL